MEKKKVQKTTFVKEIPPKNAYNPWVERLAPLINHPGRPAQIFEADSSDQANQSVDNLSRRNVVIPHPDHNWEFSARGVLVFAIYRGRGRKLSTRKPRTKKI